MAQLKTGTFIKISGNVEHRQVFEEGKLLSWTKKNVSSGATAAIVQGGKDVRTKLSSTPQGRAQFAGSSPVENGLTTPPLDAASSSAASLGRGKLGEIERSVGIDWGQLSRNQQASMVWGGSAPADTRSIQEILARRNQAGWIRLIDERGNSLLSERPEMEANRGFQFNFPKLPSITGSLGNMTSSLANTLQNSGLLLLGGAVIALLLSRK